MFFRNRDVATTHCRGCRLIGSSQPIKPEVSKLLAKRKMLPLAAHRISSLIDDKSNAPKAAEQKIARRLYLHCISHSER